MRKIIGVDFESTYQKGVRGASELGPMPYAMHPDTEIYLASIDTGSEIIVGVPDEIPWNDITGSAFEWVSHNRTFDMSCWRRVQHDNPHLRRCEPSRWHCSADLGALLGIKRDLGSCAKYLLGEDVLKDTRNKTNNKSAEWIYANIWDEITEYAGEDARITRQLWLHYGHHMSETERWLSEYTTESCLRGVGIDLDFLEDSIDTMKKVVFDIEQRIPWVGEPDKKGKPYTAGSRTALIAHCGKVGIKAPSTTAKDSPKFDAWVAEVGVQADFALALNEFRSAYKLLGELQTVEQRVGVPGYPEHVMPFALKYRGAHHGRWSGDGGFNMQNPARDARFGIKIRHIFVPRERDCVFVACDLSQIEARVLLWDVGDETQLELIRNGSDVYESHARLTMGYTDPRPLKDVDAEMRRYAKARVLGLGYGAGGKTFKEFAWKQHKLSLTLAEASQEVTKFRKKNPLITRYWKRLNNAVIRGAKENGGEYFEELPSGEFLNYRNVGKAKFGMSAEFQMGMGRRAFHGGLLTQNRVSGIARDIIGLAIRRVESNPDTPVIWTMHDEVIVEVPRQHASHFQIEVEQKLTEVPHWCQGLPIACESAILEKYDK